MPIGWSSFGVRLERHGSCALMEGSDSREARWARPVATLVVAGGRRLARCLPTRLRRAIDDRVFYAVFNLTRVTNDAYGWRPGPDERS